MLRSRPRAVAVAGTVTAMLSAAAALVAAPQAAAHSATAPNGLRYATASNRVVQRQPPAGSCRARGHGLYSRPDPRCTPGALNPAVTQATIARTICRSGWTESVRPAESITEPEKYASMAAYGDSGSASGYEYDHFVPLELGGATNDPHNLWPEPGATPNPKDAVENYLNSQVCERRMTLARAQKLIATDWVTVYHQITRTHPQAPKGSASCSASAAWNQTYDDYDVYVHSNQPDTEARVTGAGTAAGYRTNGSGYADVYLHASKAAAGATITVTVGAATCRAAL
jgi:hypothetical protein